MSMPNIPNAISAECIPSKTEDQKPSICTKLKYLSTHITVEPLIFLYILAGMTAVLASQNLALEKACRVDLQFNISVCDALTARNKSGYTFDQEAEVQQLVTKWGTYRTIFVGSIPVLLMMFLGSWSDRHARRKPIILMPICGDLLSISGLLVCSYFFMQLPIVYSWVSESIFPSFFGGWGCMFMGIYSYVGSVSSEEDRTLKIGTVSMCTTIAMSIGVMMSGIFLNKYGFIGVYSFSGLMMVLAFLYGVIMIKEKGLEKTQEQKDKGFWKDFFAFEHIKNTFALCFKQGKENRRSKMIAIMFLAIMIVGPLQGEITVIYMYIRLKCGWNEVDYSMYNTVHFFIQILGNTFALSFFSKYLQLNDAMLGCIGMTSKIMGCLIYAFAPSGIYFYIGAFLDVFMGTTHIALRSLMAKIVPPHELGQSSSVFGICEALMPLAFGPLYTTIYMKTLPIFSGAFYLLSTAIYLVSVAVFLWLYMESKKSAIIQSESDEATEQEKGLLKKNYPTEIKKSLETLKA